MISFQTLMQNIRAFLNCKFGKIGKSSRNMLDYNTAFIWIWWACPTFFPYLIVVNGNNVFGVSFSEFIDCDLLLKFLVSEFKCVFLCQVRRRILRFQKNWFSRFMLDVGFGNFFPLIKIERLDKLIVAHFILSINHKSYFITQYALFQKNI